MPTIIPRTIAPPIAPPMMAPIGGEFLEDWEIVVVVGVEVEE